MVLLRFARDPPTIDALWKDPDADAIQLLASLPRPPARTRTLRQARLVPAHYLPGPFCLKRQRAPARNAPSAGNDGHSLGTETGRARTQVHL